LIDFSAYIHHPDDWWREELIHGYKDRFFKDSTYIVHFRDFISDAEMEDRKPHSSVTKTKAFFVNDSKYAKLDEQLDSFLARRPNARKVISESAMYPFRFSTDCPQRCYITVHSTTVTRMWARCLLAECTSNEY
jgi:hypothetical protein